MLNSYLSLAHSGLLESAIDGANGAMPSTNRTDSLLLLQDAPDAAYASQLDMTGNQWGVIKETGNYPGAVWLWFYTLLYQIPPFSGSDSADLWVVVATGLVSVLLILIPFIPGLRSLPKVFGIYRLIWRRYYRNEAKKGGATGMKNKAKTSKSSVIRRVLVPPVWVVMVLTFVGIYATNLVYWAVVHGAWRGGIVGAVLLAIAVYVTGTPLAASMWNHKERKSRRPSQQPTPATKR